ncbi:helix-turn-helix domain-containing protein [Actinokineospora spheciospongiae]|uniref:helix-turn-helix domain-containing protein n=1 Tax=Actinokineospora spheciospongiae TaxID=909613 RepID=UPI000D7106DE|nr:helix-turn-helix transcriptional regulator [Actinokineospora spheciospongiae]PWW65824.1 helix-turn-helix protein [Actinokineospora spheciospongiae]
MAKAPKTVVLGRVLRREREERGIGLREFAGRIDRDPAVLSRWETGERTPKPEDVARILTVLGIGGQRYTEVMTLIHGAGESHWLALSSPEHRQQVAAFGEYERSAKTIHTVSPLLIPGILQVTDYIAAIMSEGGLPPEQAAANVARRVARRAVLSGPEPARLVALIGQAALHQEVGGRATMLAQLRHLVDVARLPNVELRVVPFGQGWHPALEGPFCLMESDSLPPGVFLELRRTAVWLHSAEDVAVYRAAVDGVMRAALSEQGSLRLIADLLRRAEADLPVPA